MSDDLIPGELEAKIQTYEHIDKIREMLRLFAVELITRGETHDRSKLQPAESKVFAAFTPKLKGSTYGSEEYKGFLRDMKPALDHHYANNRHHAEFFDTDEWRPVLGFRGHYEVSSFGRVRSLDRVVDRPGKGDTVSKKGGLRKLFVTPRGYHRVQLSLDGCIKNMLVHRLVAESFIPNPENKPEVNHKNGLKHDNRVENLEWVTESENQLHAYETGLKEPSWKYVVSCDDLDLVTLGMERMVEELHRRGHADATPSGVYNAMLRCGTHVGLRFSSSLLEEARNEPISRMNLLDVLEMWIDWYCSSMRHANGSMAKSIDINEVRFSMGPQLAAIFRNTLRDLNDGTLSKNKEPPPSV